MKRLREYAAEIIVLFGCACVLYGLSMWNTIAAWIIGGLMAIAFGILIAVREAKVKAKNAVTE